MDAFGATGTYTVTQTASASSISARLSEIEGTEWDRWAELSIYDDATNGIADPQPGDTWTESGGTVWTVHEIKLRTGGRHLLNVHTPREQERPIQ